MQRLDRAWAVGTTVAGLALAGVVVLGVLVRLAEPLSSPVVPAEDPYTHMARVRNHVSEGSLSPLTGGSMYPPGMHAFVVPVWAFSGLGLYELFRFMPVALGALGVLGMGLVLWRFVGPVAGLVGALAYALAPEVVFRTTMMAPTALDLALIPFLLFALLELVKGDVGWVAAAAALSVFLVFAHPWLFGILGLMGGFFLVLVPVAARVSPGAWRVSPLGLAFAIAVVGSSVGLTFWGCGGFCGLGFEHTIPFAGVLTALAPVVFLASFVPLVVVGLWPAARAWRLAPQGGPWPWWARAGLSVLLGGALVAVVSLASEGGFPQHVNLVRMLGWPTLALAAFAFVALPFVASPVAVAGAGLAVATFPMVVFNPLGSEFWPHRTVAYLAVGVAILVGVAGGAAAAAVRRVWNRAASWVGEPRGAGVASLVVLIVAGGALGGSLVAGTPDPYEEGWYRLYEPCELEAFEEVEAWVAGEDRSLVIVGDWRPGIVLPAVAEETDQVWFKADFFSSQEERSRLMGHRSGPGESLFVVEERHLRTEQPGQTGFLQGDDWRRVDAWCADELSQRHRVVLYEATG